VSETTIFFKKENKPEFDNNMQIQACFSAISIVTFFLAMHSCSSINDVYAYINTNNMPEKIVLIKKYLILPLPPFGNGGHRT
jgi:hypothetical protein